MKKYLNLLLILFCCLLLTGCKGKKEVLKCEGVSKQTNYTISTNYEIESRDNIVSKVIVKQVIQSKNKKILTSFKKQLTNQYKSNNSTYGGYKYDININGKKLTSNVEIDYESINLKRFIKDNSAMKDYVNKDNQFTLDGAKKLYESTGSKCE